MAQCSGMKTADPTREQLIDEFESSLEAGVSQPCFWSEPVVIGVSGGGDSVGLLVGLERLARAREATGRLFVAHAQHDLRPQASSDRAFVALLARRLGLPFVWRELPVRDGRDERGEGMEARVRRLRYDFLAESAREAGARHVVVAHTADDQAETILHRALRGTGLAGLGGMPASRELCDGVALLRPLLGVCREDVRRYCHAVGEPWCEDESNADTRYARNFLRHDILPRVAAGPYPAAAASIGRLGRQASQVAAAIASAAGHLLDVHACRQADGTILVRTAAFAALDPHLVAEIFVALWRREQWPRRDMTSRHYTALAAMAASTGAAAAPGAAEVVSALDMPGGIRVRVAGRGMLSFTSPS
jgi:tRNA(Ile)-lysidine synthase